MHTIGDIGVANPVLWCFVGKTAVDSTAGFRYLGWSIILVKWINDYYRRTLQLYALSSNPLKYAVNYLKGTWHFDVHPPLGKMLIASLWNFCGLENTEFGFGLAEAYPDNTYVCVRRGIAGFGALLAPFSYLAARNLHLSFSASLLVALLVTFGMLL